MTPQDFIAKWGAPDGVPGPAYGLNEEQGAQSHFLDLCELLAVPKPGSEDGYRFEEKSAVIGGKTGYADVFKRGVFAWENKAPGKNLDTALKQLLTYSLALSSPPILVVSDRLTICIHTQFTGHPSQTHSVNLYELDQPDKRALLRRIWTAPESFKPAETNRDITEADLKALHKRTLTNLYNTQPAWLTLAHQQLDLAVAAAYGWADYSPAMADDEILKRPLALNLARSGGDAATGKLTQSASVTDVAHDV